MKDLQTGNRHLKLITSILNNFGTFGVTPALRSFLMCDPDMYQLLDGKSDAECIPAIEGLLDKLRDYQKKKREEYAKYVKSIDDDSKIAEMYDVSFGDGFYYQYFEITKLASLLESITDKQKRAKLRTVRIGDIGKFIKEVNMVVNFMKAVDPEVTGDDADVVISKIDTFLAKTKPKYLVAASKDYCKLELSIAAMIENTSIADNGVLYDKSRIVSELNKLAKCIIAASEYSFDRTYSGAKTPASEAYRVHLAASMREYYQFNIIEDLNKVLITPVLSALK